MRHRQDRRNVPVPAEQGVDEFADARRFDADVPQETVVEGCELAYGRAPGPGAQAGPRALPAGPGRRGNRDGLARGAARRFGDSAAGDADVGELPLAQAVQGLRRTIPSGLAPEHETEPVKERYQTIAPGHFSHSHKSWPKRCTRVSAEVQSRPGPAG
jgi:hypothetical protein